MVIESLLLRNIKSFKEIELSLARLSLLTGLNGSGKSSALQALGALRQSHEAGALAHDGLMLNGRYVDWGTGQDVLHEDYAEGPRLLPEVAIGLETESENAEWSFEYEREADLLRLSDSQGAVTGTSIFPERFQFIRADRITPAVHYERSHEMVVRQRSLGARGEYVPDYLREFRDERVPRALWHDGAESAGLLDQCSAWLGELCPGVNIVASALEGTDLVRLSFGFFGTAGLASTNRFRATNVGFGLTYVLPILVACLTGGPSGLVLLENPEAHLHPRGQAAMGRLMAKAAAQGTQIIVETHSDHVLNGVRLAVKDTDISGQDVSLLFFAKGADGLRIDNPVVRADGALSSWPSGFFDEWELALQRLLE
jgi:predicted ATPase